MFGLNLLFWFSLEEIEMWGYDDSDDGGDYDAGLSADEVWRPAQR